MAQITEKIVEIKAHVDGENSVKALREQIAELTRLMDTLDKESQEYKDTVNTLVDAEEKLTNVMKVGKSQLSAQEGSYNALVNRMAALKKAHKAVTDETTRNRLSEEINDINNQLKEMDANNGVYVRNVGNYENAIKEALKTPQQELKQLRTQLAGLTEGTDEYNAVFNRMAQLTHDVTEQQEMLRWSSADLGDILGNVAGVATSLAGGFSAFNALTSLIGGESKELEEAMAQAQRFIQLIQGMEQLEQLADKLKGLYKGLKIYSSALFESNKATTANATATNTMSAANVTATVTTGALSKALGVLKTALISTGIGAIVVALGALLALLGKGLGHVWGWISGANKAAETTENLKNSMTELNETLDDNERAWKRRELLMKAQGATSEELYKAERKSIQDRLTAVRILLNENEAIAENIGAKKLQKEKYDEFRESLEELRKQEEELSQELQDFDWETYCANVERARKANEEKAKAQKKAAEEAEEAYKQEMESAEKLHKETMDFFKDERTKLKEKYDEEKKLLEKHGKETATLTRKYEKEVTDIELKEAQYRKQLREQFQKDFDASFRYPSIEYFQNELDKANTKLEDFRRINDELAEDSQGAVWMENMKYLKETYDVEIQNMEHFTSVFKKVNLDYEDAQKALSDYQTQLARERITALEQELAVKRELMDFDNEKNMLEYEDTVSKTKWYGDFNDNYITQMKLRWQTEDDIYKARKERLEEEIRLYKEEAEKITNSEEAKNEALAKAAELERQLALETADYTIAQNSRKIEASENYIAAIQDSLDGISSILSNVADAWETSIQAQVDAGEISEEEGERQMENMKGIQSAIALINAFSSAVSAYNSLASIPYVGVPLAIAASAAALASGLAQVDAINKVKKGDKGTDVSNKYAQVTPSIPNYNPTAVTNITGGREQEDLANALSRTPIRAYVVESEMTSTQNKVSKREKETTF